MTQLNFENRMMQEAYDALIQLDFAGQLRALEWLQGVLRSEEANCQAKAQEPILDKLKERG